MVHHTVRPKSVGDIIDAAFRQFRKHFSFIMIASMCIVIPYFILEILFGGKAFSQYLSILTTIKSNPTPMNFTQLFQSGAFSFLPMLLVLSAISVLAVRPLLYGTILRLVTGELLENKTTPLADAFSYSLRRLLAVIATNIFVWILWFIALLIVSVVSGLIAFGLAKSHLSAVIGVIVTVVLFIAVLCVMIWTSIKISFSSSVVREEPSVFWQPLVRSWTLTRNSLWRLIGFFLLLEVISAAITAGFSFVSGLFHSTVLVFTVSAIVQLFLMPFVMLCVANMYVDLRVRTDALDLRI